MKKILCLLIVAVMTCTMLTACGSSQQENTNKQEADKQEDTNKQENTSKKVIKMGTMATNLDSVEAGRESLEEMGYTLEVVTFDDITMPNTALAEGSIDANYYQHKYYMESFNKANNTNLAMLEPQLTYTRCAAYSDKWNSVSELPDGAKVTVSSDATNLSRALLILQDLKLIKLNGDKDVYSELDITENPKNIELIKTTGASVVSTLKDADLIVVYNKYWVKEGYDTSKAWITEGDRYEFAQGLVINGDNVDEQWAKDLIKAYTSEKTKAKLQELSKGVYDVLF